MNIWCLSCINLGVWLGQHMHIKHWNTSIYHVLISTAVQMNLKLVHGWVTIFHKKEMKWILVDSLISLIDLAYSLCFAGFYYTHSLCILEVSFTSNVDVVFELILQIPMQMRFLQICITKSQFKYGMGGKLRLTVLHGCKYIFIQR